jgi:uncharacterized protein (UPF0297 family)
MDSGEQAFITQADFGGNSLTREIVDFKVTEDGCETYYAGEPYPIRLCLQPDKQDTIARVKRLIPSLLRTVSNHKIIGALYLWLNWKELVDYIHFALTDVYAKPDYYNQPVRELYMVLSDRGIDQIRDIVCAVVEYDSAYRFRFQDIAGELNQYRMATEPIEELKRLWSIYQEREGEPSQKFSKFMPFVLWLLKLNTKLLDLLKEIAKDLNIDEVKPNAADTYWMLNGGDYYKYKGI